VNMEDFKISDDERLSEAGALISEMIHFARYKSFFRCTAQTSTGNVVVVDQQHLDVSNSDVCRYRWKILVSVDQDQSSKIMLEGALDDNSEKFSSMMDHMDGYHKTRELHDVAAEQAGLLNDKLREYEFGLDALLF
jgi:hypothetical protein